MTHLTAMVGSILRTTYDSDIGKTITSSSVTDYSFTESSFCREGQKRSSLFHFRACSIWGSPTHVSKASCGWEHRQLRICACGRGLLIHSIQNPGTTLSRCCGLCCYAHRYLVSSRAGTQAPGL